jgi:phage-related tail protein
VLHGFDLASAATNLLTGAKGGQTRFDQLSGNALIAGKGYKLRNVRIASGALSAQGNVDVSPAKALGGRVDVELKRTAGVVSVPLAVSGTLSDPMLMPTKGALAGAVAGSVLLPGVGTAAGASVGDKIGKFFGGK